MYKRLLAGAVSFVLALGCFALPESVLEDTISKSFISANAEGDEDSSEIENSDDTSSDDTSDVENIEDSSEEISDVDSEEESVIDESSEESSEESSVAESSSNAESSSKADSSKVVSDFEYVALTKTTVAVKKYKGKATNVVIPSKAGGKTVTAIGNYAFADTKVVSVTAPDTVVKMGEGAFYNCGKITAFKTSSKSKLANVGKLAFYKCVSLSKLVLPVSVTVIDDYAFYSSGLSSVTLPSKLTRVGELAFADCVKLLTVNIPNSVTKIGSLAFGYKFESHDSKKNVDNYDKINGFKVNCYYNSLGQKYAQNNGFTFSLLNPGFQVTGFRVLSRQMNKIYFTWNKSAGANGYIVYRLDDATNSWKKIARSRININTYPAKKLTPGTTYKFAIKAYKTINGKDVLSATFPIVTTSTIPSAVTGLKVDATSSNAVKFSWDKDSTVKGFIVYEAINNKWTRIATTANNSYLAKNLKSGTAYRFAVKSYATDNGVTATSKTFPTVTAVTNMPDVTGFKVLATGGSAIKLACNKVTDATGYVFYRANAGKWVNIGVSKTNAFTDGNLNSGTSYRYAVKTYKTVGGKNYYSKSFPTLWSSTNPAVVNFTLTSAEKQVTAKWTRTPGATGYIVYTKANATDAWQKVATVTDTSYTIDSLETDSVLYVTVKAYKESQGKTYTGLFTTKSVKVK